MNTKYLDLYTDYLAVTFGHATATGLSNMLDGNISHDKLTRFLADGEWSSKDLWKQVKWEHSPKVGQATLTALSEKTCSLSMFHRPAL